MQEFLKLEKSQWLSLTWLDKLILWFRFRCSWSRGWVEPRLKVLGRDSVKAVAVEKEIVGVTVGREPAGAVAAGRAIVKVFFMFLT